MTKKRSFENKLRLILVAVTALIHAALLFFVVFPGEEVIDVAEPVSASVIRLVDVRELSLPPVVHTPREPPPAEVFSNTAEAIAETMIETDEVPPDIVYENVILPTITETAAVVVEEPIHYVPMSRVTDLPRLPEYEIQKAVVYPPIALRSGIEGFVFLELFVDRHRDIRNITILREEPEGRGFGEAALNAFKGIKADSPAMVLNSDGAKEPVAVRFRYRLVFKITN